MAKLLCILAVILLTAQTVLAANRVVICTIATNNQIAYKGPCLFMPEAGGSFSLSNTNRQGPLFGDIGVLSIYIVSKGTAEVRGLTSSGINSRWGEARRSTKDRACWEGADFKICAH